MATARFELLEILSDVACHEASRLSTLSNTNSSPHASQSTSTTLDSDTHARYSSAYVRHAPSRDAPLAVVRVLNASAPQLGGVRKPNRAPLPSDPPSRLSSAVAVVAGWKGRSTPSRFCHICSRTAKKVELLACANLASGACLLYTSDAADD